MGYVHDIDTLAVPIDRPVNTTTYGKKFGKSEQIGL